MAKKMLWQPYLAVRMKRAGITSTEKLAQRTGMGINKSYRIARGGANVKAADVERIATAFGEDMSDFVRNVTFVQQGGK